MKAKALIGKNICTPVFIAALFTIFKIWRQPLYKMKCYLATKKNELLPFVAARMDLDGLILLSEISQ